MKTLKTIRTVTLIICISLGINFSSCKKKTAATVDPPPANGTLMLHLHTNADTNEVDTYVTQTYTMTGGRKISVNISQMYISSIGLVNTDGSIYYVHNLNILKLMETEQYLVGSVPSGNYTSIMFTVGLPVATNAATPAVNDSTLNRANMWFGATAQPLCYVFVNFQGKIDTSTAANGTLAQMQTFSYKIGTNANAKIVSMPNQNYAISPNQTQYVHIVVDYNKLFTGITLNNSGNLIMNTAAANTGTLATKLFNNIPLMFRYEM